MKIILFGSTGMLGTYVYTLLSETYDITTFTRKEFDILNDSWEKLIDLLDIFQKNDVIINCAGIIPQKVMSNYYREYIHVNTLFPHKLQEICNKKKIKLIHITTDCVYDGKKGDYVKDDVHTATDIYGTTKSLGESQKSTIIRTSIIGEELTGQNSLLEWIKSNKNKTINGFANHYWNGVTCLTLSKIIKSIIDKKDYWTGVRHIFSPNTVTKYDLCKYINEIYNLNLNIILYDKQREKNLTLSGNKYYEIKDIYSQIIEQKSFNLNDQK